MFVLLAGRRSAEADGRLEAMAGALRGVGGAPRVWRDGDRNSGAASLAPRFVPEDVFDEQPLVAEHGLFVCQARIDNRPDVLRRLGIAPDAPIADSSVLAAAYARWGEACTVEVTGDYAFVAWHRADGRVVGAVDHLGTRRLLWARVGTGIALSGQLPPLLAHPHVSHDPDLPALASLLDAGVDRSSTPFTSIRSLPGGHVLRWRAGDGAPHIARWWHPDSQPVAWHRDPENYVAETRELLTRAVTTQLRSDGPLSTTLSGGLDSGCVTAVAAPLLAARGARLTAYTSVPADGLAPSERHGWDADDRSYAASVVALHQNLDHRLVPPGQRSVLDVVRDIHMRAATPTKSATNLLWIQAISASAAAAGSRVLLVGQHGNAAFSWRGGDPLAELARLGRPRAAFAQAALEARARRISVAHLLAGAVRASLRGSSRRRTLGDLLVPPGLAFVDPARRRALPARGGLFAEVAGSHAAWVAFATTPRHTWSPDPVAQWGVEWRDPTADRQLVERLLQFPQAAFRIHGLDRGLAREVARGLLPDSVRLRATQGAQVPEAPNLIAANSSQYIAALEEMRTATWCRELFDLEALRRSLLALVRGSNDYYLALAVDRAFDIGLFLIWLEGRR